VPTLAGGGGGVLEPRSGDVVAPVDTGAADTGLMEMAEWAEPESMTDSY